MTITIGPPAQIRLEASSFCNLRCPLCPTTTGDVHHQAVGGGFLRFEDFRKLLDDNPGLKRIELSNYGEVFLNPALLRMLELAHQRGIELTANNGVHLNKVRPEVLEGLVKYQFRRLMCSIDGASGETYSIYRIRGRFTNVIDNIRKINTLKQRYCSPFPALTWKFVVFGHNEHELPVAREMARELGMEFYPALNWDDNFSPVRDPEAVRAATGTGAATFDEYEALHGRSYYEPICHQLWDDPQINWDGKLLGCCVNYWGDFGGNAFRDGLTASVNTEQIVYARAMLLGHAPSRGDIPCTNCKYYHGMRKRNQWLERGARKIDPIGQENPPRERATVAVQLSVADLLAAGLAHHQAGRLAEAEAHYQQVLAAIPGHGDALHLLGVIAYQSNRPEMAIELIGQAIEHNGNIASYHTSCGLALQSLRRLGEALDNHDRALALDRDNVEALNNRGLVLQELERFDEALESYDRALAVRPDFAKALNNRGNALRALERLEEAVASYDRALALDPRLVETSYNRGEALRDLEQSQLRDRPPSG
jgi:tetratricopeptide (TPR) repeat protein